MIDLKSPRKNYKACFIGDDHQGYWHCWETEKTESYLRLERNLREM